MKNELICYEATVNNHYNCLKYAHENGCPLTNEDMLLMCSDNIDKFKCFKYLSENGAYRAKYIALTACVNRNFVVVKYCIDNKFFINEWLCVYLVKVNSLEYLKYAHENGCPWDCNTFICCMV